MVLSPESRSEKAAFFGLPSVAGEPGLLKEAGVTPTGGKTIRIAVAAGQGRVI